MADRTCTLPDCGAKHWGKGLCKPHYEQMAYRRRKDPEAWARLQAEKESAEIERQNKDAAPTKRCSKCKVDQDRSEFSPMPRMRDGLHSWCKGCNREYARRTYDPAKARDLHIERSLSADYLALRKRVYDRWRAEHPDRAKAATDRWRAENPDKVRAARQAWAQANQERIRANRLKWRTENPEKYRLVRRAANARRDKRIREQAEGDRVDYVTILAEHGMVCHLCGEDIASLDDLHFDHVIPLAKGGPHSTANVRPSHAHCNMKKGARVPA